LKPRNIGLPAIHTRINRVINRVFQKNLLVEEDFLGKRGIGLKREPPHQTMKFYLDHNKASFTKNR
jgi:hypothetical protein